MEYDKTRYVAPGVPIISQQFVEAQIKLLRSNPMDFLESLGRKESINGQNNFLETINHLLDTGLESILEQLDAKNPRKYLKKQFLLGGALTNEFLVYVCNQSPEVPFEKVLTSSKDILNKIENGKIGQKAIDYFTERLEESNPMLLRGLVDVERILFSQDKLDDSSNYRVLLVFRGFFGSKVAFRLLNGQREVYGLEDQFKS